MKTNLRASVSGLLGLVLFGALLFGTAGTFDYWQAWVFIAILTAVSIFPTVYLAVKDPATLERRMHGGPLAETRTAQKIAASGFF